MGGNCQSTLPMNLIHLGFQRQFLINVCLDSQSQHMQTPGNFGAWNAQQTRFPSAFLDHLIAKQLPASTRLGEWTLPISAVIGNGNEVQALLQRGLYHFFVGILSVRTGGMHVQIAAPENRHRGG
jgi:hypothetical protein